MKIPNLKNLMISVTDIKKMLNEVVNKDMTKVIVKNNEPRSVIMPYNEYVELNEKIGDTQALLHGIGHNITLANGVQIMVCVETGKDKVSNDEIAVKTYIKMKSSNDYKLHYTLRLSQPSIEDTLTAEELREYYLGSNEIGENE